MELYAAVERNAERHGLDEARAGARARGRPRARPLRLLVRGLPALVGRPRGRRGAGAGARRAGLRRALHDADPPDRARRTARAATTRSSPAPTTPARPTRSARRRAATTPCTRTSARSRTSAGCAPPRRSTAWTSRMDFAINASADHPWLTEHPDWFHRRPDGTLKYAENPPKRYQDIYNVNWECEDWRGLWEEWRRIFLFWVEQGVKVYRVDNPHTKPIVFWEWLIAEVHKVDRDVIFLAEAFTQAGDDAPARQDRLHPGLHVLHLEEQPPRADRVRRTSWPGGRRRTTSARTSSPTRPTSSTPTSCTAGRPRSTRASCSRPR